MKETDLFPPIKKYLLKQGYEVYSEVEGKWFKKRADIIATNKNNLIALEMKTSLSFQLIDQARFWLRFSDYVFIVIPKVKTERSYTAIETLKSLGIGMLEVDMKKYQILVSRGNEDDVFSYINKVLDARKNQIDSRSRKQFEQLTEEHKTWSVGGSQSKNSKYVTSYSLLMKDVYSYLRSQLDTKNEGWVTHRDIWNYILENSRDVVKSHYSGKSPAESLKNSLLKFENEEIEMLKIGNKSYFRILPESTKYLNM